MNPVYVITATATAVTNFSTTALEPQPRFIEMAQPKQEPQPQFSENSQLIHHYYIHISSVTQHENYRLLQGQQMH